MWKSGREASESVESIHVSNAAMSSINLDPESDSVATWSNVALSDCDVRVMFKLPADYESMENRSRISCDEASGSEIAVADIKLCFSDSDVSCDLSDVSEIKLEKQSASFIFVDLKLAVVATSLSLHRPLHEDVPVTQLCRGRGMMTPERRVETAGPPAAPVTPQPPRRSELRSTARIRRAFQGLGVIPAHQLRTTLEGLGLLDRHVLRGLTFCRVGVDKYDAEKVKYKLISAVADRRPNRFDVWVRQALEGPVVVAKAPERSPAVRRALAPMQRNVLSATTKARPVRVSTRVHA